MDNFSLQGLNYRIQIEDLLKDHNDAEINVLFTCVMTIIRTVVANKLKTTDQRNILHGIGFNSDFVHYITERVGLSRLILEKSAVVNSVQVPKLEKLRWRVDVTISGSALLE